jgi:hypothetical protein
MTEILLFCRYPIDLQWTIFYPSLLGIPVIVIANQNVAACYFVTADHLFVICSSILLLIFLPKILASRKKKDSRTPINRWSRPVEGRTGEYRVVEEVDSNNRLAIAIVSLGKSALEQENLELKNLVESLSRRLEQNQEIVNKEGDNEDQTKANLCSADKT